MPISRNALLRQRVIDRYLSKGAYSTEELMEACNLALESRGEAQVQSLNTIRADMRAIEFNYGVDANIKKVQDGHFVKYTYEKEGFSIFVIPLTDSELVKITQTISILSRFKGMPQFNWMDEYAKRLEIVLPVDADTPIVGFDENMKLKGKNYFAELFQAIMAKTPLELEYKSFKSLEPKKKIVHPYYLKQYNKRWFLVAYSEGYNNLSLFAFDRIEGITQRPDIDYVPNMKYDFNKYFDDMIGVSIYKETEPETVKIWVAASRWPYIESKPLHSTQEVVSDECDSEGTVIQIKVYPNRELEQLLLSYGQDVKVLAPESLKQRMKEHFKEGLKNYE